MTQSGVIIEMLALAIDRADPEKVARVLEGMRLPSAVQMRADTHQLIQPLFVALAAKVDSKKIRID